MQRFCLAAALAALLPTAAAITPVEIPAVNWPSAFGSLGQLHQAMKQHPIGPAELGAPVYPGAVYDAACSADYTWPRRSYDIVGVCFKFEAEGSTVNEFITGRGRPLGWSPVISGNGLIYQTSRQQLAMAMQVPQEPPAVAELGAPLVPDARYDRACTAQQNFDRVVMHDDAARAWSWCYVGEDGQAARRFLADFMHERRSTMTKVDIRHLGWGLDRVEIVYQIPRQ